MIARTPSADFDAYSWSDAGSPVFARFSNTPAGRRGYLPHLINNKLNDLQSTLLLSEMESSDYPEWYDEFGARFRLANPYADIQAQLKRMIETLPAETNEAEREGICSLLKFLDEKFAEQVHRFCQLLDEAKASPTPEQLHALKTLAKDIAGKVHLASQHSTKMIDALYAAIAPSERARSSSAPSPEPKPMVVGELAMAVGFGLLRPAAASPAAASEMRASAAKSVGSSAAPAANV
jgi:hypothetical protein